MGSWRPRYNSLDKKDIHVEGAPMDNMVSWAPKARESLPLTNCPSLVILAPLLANKRKVVNDLIRQCAIEMYKQIVKDWEGKNIEKAKKHDEEVTS